MAACIRHLPAESACNRALGADGISLTETLLFDLVSVMSGEPHPGDPRWIREQRIRAAELEEAKRRSEERRARLGMRGSVFRRHREA